MEKALLKLATFLGIIGALILLFTSEWVAPAFIFYFAVWAMGYAVWSLASAIVEDIRK